MRHTAVTAVLSSLALLGGAQGADAAGGQKLVKTSASGVFLEHPIEPGGCGWGAGFVIGPVAGAKSYLIKYYDGYWQRLEVRTVTVAELKANPDSKGALYFGVTGGTYGAPCEGGEPTQGGRFSKGAKAWAIFPANYKPKATLKIKIDVPKGGVAVNGSVDVKVTAKAGLAALKDVNLGRGLQAAGDLAEVTKRASGLSGFSLAAGASKSFSFTVKAKKPGAAVLTARGTGRAKSRSVSGSDSATLRIAEAQLALTLGATPTKLNLPVTDEGKVNPNAVYITARFTNTGDTPVENVSLQSLRPVPVKEGERLDQLAFPAGTLPVDFGTIQPNSTASRTFGLEVTGDGRYEIKALALYAAEGGANGRLAVTGGKFESVVPLVFFAPKRADDNIELRGGQPWVKGGQSWYVNAKIANLSDYQRVCIAPLFPLLRGNAAATGPVDITKSNLREVGGPYSDALAPGNDTVLQMYVDTAIGGATGSYVQLKPAAGRLDPGEDCNEATYKRAKKLGPAEFHIPKATGTEFAVHVDIAVTPPGAYSLGTRTVHFFGGFARNVLLDTVRQITDLVALGKETWTAELEFERVHPLAPPIAGYIVVKSAQALAVATDVYAQYWRQATAYEKGNIFKKVGAFLGETTNDFYKNGVETVREVAQPWMDQMEKAYATGDEATIGRLWGQVAGSIAQQAVLGMFTKLLGARILAEEAELEAKMLKAEHEWKQAQAAHALDEATDTTTTVAKKTVPPGTALGIANKSGIWGIDALTDGKLSAIAKKFKILIGVRSRSPASIKKLRGGSVWKHENIKPKNVNDIDIEFLGFRPDDIDEVRFRSYTPEQLAAIQNRINTEPLSAAQRKAIQKRFNTRAGEATEHLGAIEGFSKDGKIDVSFNYKDNGIDRTSRKDFRKFKLDSESASATKGVPEGGVYYTPYQENPKLFHLRGKGTLPPNCKRRLSAVLCTVTGDVDGVYVTQLDGSAIPKDQLVEIYGELAEAGWQHPETVTWIDKQREFYFDKKLEILQGLEEGGEAMVEYAPDGVTRATYLNIEGSSLIGGENYKLKVIGGYTAYSAAGNVVP